MIIIIALWPLTKIQLFFVVVQDRTEVSFEWDNVRVKDELLVGGFEVSGSVQSVDENAAVPGVDFILYSASDLKDLPLSCSTDGVSGTPPKQCS